MTKDFTLQPLVDLSHQKNEAATRNLGQLNQQQQAEQKKLETLLQFRRDYQTKFREATRSGMDSAGVGNFQNFLDRLDEAVQQQRNVIEEAGRSVQAGQDALLKARISMKSFDTLAQRHAEKVRKHDLHADQKLQDEQSGQFAARNGQSENQP